ncbi:protein CASP-like [Corticium candelabrum]|uniref:protein CASP-like n=1 Tax=Corticium candelabrum TaxID=121492 RepID=UPI002E26949E|nr:protein CASP-like [Corticium candelabrum]
MALAQYWKDFGLQQLQRELDVVAADTAKRQDESDNSRRRLIEQSREFKRSATEETRKQVAPLLKSFQAEIDSLSRRCKAAEAAFLNLYKKLVDAPDPTPLLEQAAERQKKIDTLQAFEIENKKLRKTLEEYNAEFAQVKNQEVTVSRLKEKLKEYEDKEEQAVMSKVKEKEHELQQKFGAKEHELQNTQLAIVNKLGESEQQVCVLQAALDSSQSELFDLKAKYEEQAAAKVSEMEIIVTDLERTLQRAETAEKELEQTQTQLRDCQARQDHTDEEKSILSDSLHSLSQSNLQVELAAKEGEISQLVADIQQLQSSLNKMRDSGLSKVAMLEEQLTAKSAAIESLEARLVQQQDYEEIKRELKVLKTMEFSLDFGEEELKTSEPKTLEVLLLEKNRNLQSENTALRVTQSGLESRLSVLESGQEDAKKTIEEQRSLIEQLETDLVNVQSFLPVRTEGEGEASPVGVAGILKTQSEPVYATGSGTADSLLPIISSQRERFRARNMELEAETRHHQQVISSLRNEVDTLRSDNVKLYEKIKFLQSYSATSKVRQGDDAVHRYSMEYEEKMDPFSAFSKKEKEKRYLGLSGPERATLNLGRFILSNKFARTFVFFYTIIIHLLIFTVLYQLASTAACKREVATDCFRKYAQHMQQEHGMNSFTVFDAHHGHETG